MKTIVSILLCSLILFSCKQKEARQPLIKPYKQSIVKPTAREIIEKTEIDLNQILSRFEIKGLPVIDSTNYNNVTEDHYLSQDEVKAMFLHMIYPDFFKETHNYKAKPNYRIELFQEYYTLVFIIFKGENELESTLVNYKPDGTLIDHKVIAYDEIAEGWSQKKSTIQKDFITITNILWVDEKQETTTMYGILPEGKIVELSNNY